MRVRVWIEPGCIQCNWCSDLAPEVFTIGPTTTHIRAEARADHVTDRNERRAALVSAYDEAGATYLEFVAGGCPVQVIKLGVDETTLAG